MQHHRPRVFHLHSAGVLALLLGAVVASAQTPATGVYRCGNSYSDAPCPGGTAVAADDPRSAAQQQQSQDAKRREANLADRLAAERRARERAAIGQRAAGIGPTSADAAGPAASKPKPLPSVVKVRKTKPGPKAKSKAAGTA